jgi:uncharacterized protein YjbI with pentapeptide repeats
VTADGTLAAGREGSWCVWPKRPSGEVNFCNADLRDPDLVGALLDWADFTDADLSSAKLSHADLLGANLDHANLDRANLDEATLSSAQF